MKKLTQALKKRIFGGQMKKRMQEGIKGRVINLYN